MSTKSNIELSAAVIAIINKLTELKELSPEVELLVNKLLNISASQQLTSQDDVSGAEVSDAEVSSAEAELELSSGNEKNLLIKLLLESRVASEKEWEEQRRNRVPRQMDDETRKRYLAFAEAQKTKTTHI
jgi:Arc/MetJ family transcription regulator